MEKPTEMPDLYDQLKKLDRHTRYPYHMPGHKRNPQAGPMADVMAIDITEIDGFDDLHDASGILLEAEKKAAKIYGAEETHFLVNGSTAGVLAAVSTACAAGRETAGAAQYPLLLAGRNSHLSFLHAAYLMQADVQWMIEEELTDGDARIPGTVYPAEVMEALSKASAAGRLPAAVFVTSPTYYGVIGDIPSIVEIAHSYGVPVIVDEAHGAHFGLIQGLPDSAVHAGADLVVDSLHKTLPSLTQTALIHVQGALIDRTKLRRFLRIYQTSSPSYVLMASIDSCMTMIRERPELFGGVLLYKQIILEQGRAWKHLRFLSGQLVQDPCKIVVTTASCRMTGRELYDILLENYHIEPEMAYGDEVVLILTGMDTEDGIEALLWALTEVDNFLEREGANAASSPKPSLPEMCPPEAACGIADAWDAPAEEILLKDAAGRVSAELIAPYPPGTPLLCPGERIGEDAAARIRALASAGVRVRGIGDRDGELTVRAVKQDR